MSKETIGPKIKQFQKRKLTQNELAESLDESGKTDLDDYKNHI